MSRTIVVFASVALLTGGAVARGDHPFDPALKKLMPKDQLEFVEKIEQLNADAGKVIFRFRDEAGRAKENERLGTEMTRLQQALVTKLKTEGLTGWVGKCGIIMPDTVVILDRFQSYHLELQLPPEKKKAKGPIEQALVALKVEEVVRFSTKPDAAYEMGLVRSKSYHQFEQKIKLASITAVETVPFTPTPPPAKPPARKKKSGAG